MNSVFTNRNKNFGKYGIIHLSDIILYKMEFNAWFQEIKHKNLNELNSYNEKGYYEEFISLFNNGNLPSKKYYNLIKFTKKENEQLLRKKRLIKLKNLKKNNFQDKLLAYSLNDKFIFDDEGKLAKEKKLLKELEQKKKLDEAIYAMNREKAEAMRDLELKENLMRFYYQTSNTNAAYDIYNQIYAQNEQGNMI